MEAQSGLFCGEGPGAGARDGDADVPHSLGLALALLCKQELRFMLRAETWWAQSSRQRMKQRQHLAALPYPMPTCEPWSAEVYIRFWGLRSRWAMPREWRCATPSTTCTTGDRRRGCMCQGRQAGMQVA